jgi:predicted nucleic acid-binding protein
LTKIYLLDTNAVSDLMRITGGFSKWAQKVGPDAQAIICSIVLGEILFGISALPEGKRKAALAAEAASLLDQVEHRAVPIKACPQYARIKLEGQLAGRRMGENDLWIAATAIAFGATLVSRDEAFFGVKGLEVVPFEME